MKPTKTINTFLPIFPGFYGTLFDPNDELEREIDALLDEKRVPTGWSAELDFKKYGEEVAKQACDWAHEICNDRWELCGDLFHLSPECPLGIVSITSEGVRSPTYYNYVNDSIHCAIELDTKQFSRAFNAVIAEYREEWEKYLRSHYRSCDGFTSHYPDDPLDWKQLTDDFQFTDWTPLERDFNRWYFGLPTPIERKEYLRSQKDLYKELANGTHGLGVCLDFILRESMKAPEMALYDYIRERVYVSEFITNLAEIVT